MNLLTKKDFKNADKIRSVCDSLGCYFQDRSFLNIFGDKSLYDYLVNVPFSLEAHFCSISNYEDRPFWSETEKTVYRLMFALNKRILDLEADVLKEKETTTVN